MKRTVKIFFKDNTDTTFEVEDQWLSDISDKIEKAMISKAPYILNNYDSKTNCSNTLILPIENIKYISILDDQNEQKEENKDEK